MIWYHHWDPEKPLFTHVIFLKWMSEILGSGLTSYPIVRSGSDTDRQMRFMPTEPRVTGWRGVWMGEGVREDANVEERQNSTAKSGIRAHKRTLFTPRSGLVFEQGGGGGDIRVASEMTTLSLHRKTRADNALVILHHLMHTDHQIKNSTSLSSHSLLKRLV